MLFYEQISNIFTTISHTLLFLSMFQLQVFFFFFFFFSFFPFFKMMYIHKGAFISTFLIGLVIGSRLALRPHGLQPARLFCTWNYPGKNTGVDCHFLLQGIFPTQGSSLHLLHVFAELQTDSLPVSQQGSPQHWGPY